MSAKIALFGSALTKGPLARDIDLWIIEFSDAEREELLGELALLGYLTQKDVDVKWDAYEEQSCGMSYYHHHLERWEHAMCFCGRDFFLGYQELDRSQDLAVQIATYLKEAR